MITRVFIWIWIKNNLFYMTSSDEQRLSFDDFYILDKTISNDRKNIVYFI